jgi:hypothetical protein
LGAAVVLAPLGVAILKPPKPFKNRLEAIPETSTTIDNALYDKVRIMLIYNYNNELAS